MPAATLDDAAAQSSDTMTARYNANTLPANMVTFNAAILAIFPNDGSQPERTVSNWIVIGHYVYRLCLATARAQAGFRISVAQRDAVLAAWNASLS
jgi:hypothetical protein